MNRCFKKVTSLMNNKSVKTILVGRENDAPVYLGKVVIDETLESGEILGMAANGMAEVQLDNGKRVTKKRDQLTFV